MPQGHRNLQPRRTLVGARMREVYPEVHGCICKQVARINVLRAVI
jgi:hypothetical protein